MMLVRWTLTIVLLWFVWHHAHWSVAVVLTLLAVTNEIDTWAITNILKCLMKVTDQLK